MKNNTATFNNPESLLNFLKMIKIVGKHIYLKLI